MRELLMKNLTSQTRKRAELFLSEHFEEGDFIQDYEKKTIFSIKEVLEFTDQDDMMLYINQKIKEESTDQTFLIRSFDTKEGIQKIIFKVVGEKFVVLDDKVFVIKVSRYTKRILTQKADKSIS